MMASLIFKMMCRNCAEKTGHLLKKAMFGENSNTKYSSFVSLFNSKMNFMAFAFAQQCNWVGALRLRRAYQVFKLYQRIHGDQLLKMNLLNNAKHSMTYRGKSAITLLSAAFFNWEQERITDEKMRSLQKEIAEVIKFKESMDAIKLEGNSSGDTASSDNESQWETVVDSENFYCWRKWNNDIELFTYRVLGKFDDVTPTAFYNTQVDLPYWKVWDKYTMDVEIVDEDIETGSQVIHWHYRFPWPLSPRQYVFVRRAVIDRDENIMVITSRSTEHPNCPDDSNFVRVAVYDSTMVIKPTTTFDEEGFQYLMTYCEDDKASIPTVAYKWAASQGIQNFIDQVREASLSGAHSDTSLSDSHSDMFID